MRLPVFLLTIRTLYPVRCKSCFTFLFLAKPHHFDTILSLIYMVSKLVYPNCTQEDILPKSCDMSQLLLPKITVYIPKKTLTVLKFPSVSPLAGAFINPFPHTKPMTYYAENMLRRIYGRELFGD